MAFKRLLCVSIAVNNIEDSLSQYVDGLGLKLVGEIHDGERGYGLRIAELGDGENVFLELLDAPGPGPVRDFLENHGEGVYQVRLETDGLFESVSEMAARGVKIVMPQPVGGGIPPSESPRDISVAFIHPRSTSGVLIEAYPPQS